MSYLPTRENDLKDFALNFASRIKATPGNYGLVANDATQIDNAAQDYATKYDLANAPATRTEAAVQAKNVARTTLIAVIRGYAMMIRTNRAVSDTDKINLGVGVQDLSPTPSPVPTTKPLITIPGVELRRHELRITDSQTPDKKTKPAGAAGVQLFLQLADAGAPAPSDPLACRFYGFVTKPTLKLDFTTEQGGKVAYYFARWQTSTGKVGPFSQVASMPVIG